MKDIIGDLSEAIALLVENGFGVTNKAGGYIEKNGNRYIHQSPGHQHPQSCCLGEVIDSFLEESEQE